MKDKVSYLPMKNPIYKLSRFRIFRLLAPSLVAAALAWSDFRHIFPADEALLAVFLVFVLMLCMIYVGNRVSERVSASFLASITTSIDGVAYTRSLAVTGVAALLVYTLGVWLIAHSLGWMK